MIHIVLYRPEIPPNTGNIARLCAGTQIPLHLIRPLGFSLEDRYLKRAGLDYWQHVPLSVWDSLEDYLAADGRGQRLVATSARRGTMLNHFAFTERDSLLFGPETTGLPPEVYERIPDGVRIGKNTVISGVTTPEDYNGGWLAGGESLRKVGESA